MIRRDAVQVFETGSELSRAAAELLKKVALDTTARRGRFTVVLPGGSTPRPLFRLLAREYRDVIPWSKAHVFWSDERYVPPDHPDSNFAAAEADLLLHVKIPPIQIHRIPTDFRSPDAAAIEYEVRLRSLFPTDDAPAFDLALLGLGADGHTASLFPGALQDDDRWVAAVLGPPGRPPRERITLTAKALNGAGTAVFLVAGVEKHYAIGSLLDQRGANLPAAAIHPRDDLIWMIDRAAYGGGAPK